MEQTLSAATNPALANQIAKQVMEEQQTVVGAPGEPLTPVPQPPDTSIELAAGLLEPFTGELTMSAEVRELNGNDEEALARITDAGKTLLAILQRGTVSIGDKKASEVLDDLLAGDRELLLVEIRKATFGKEVKLEGSCPSCGAPDQTFSVDLESDLPIKRLEDPVNDRRFLLECNAGVVTVDLPTGRTQAKLLQNAGKTLPELDSILLKDCVTSINGLPVMGVDQVKALGIGDRRKITDEIAKRAPGPQLSEIKKQCSACEQEVAIPLTIADLFRL